MTPPSEQGDLAPVPGLSRWVWLVFVLLAGGIGAAGHHYYRQQQERLQQAVWDELSAIADLKLTQIANWRSERLADADFVSHDVFFARTVQRWLEGRAPEQSKRDLAEWMKLLRDAYGFQNVLLLDPQLAVRLAVTEERDWPHAAAELLASESLQAKKPRLSDLERGKTGTIHLDLLSPLLVPGGESARCVGLLLMKIDPHRFLYPLIQSWPTPSRTAETLLVRPQGDGVLFLNELRHRKDTALALRIPFTKSSVPAVMAALGQEGITRGSDYRGVPVLAAIRKVPASPWSLIAKVDEEEVYAPIRQRVALMFLVVFSLIIAGAAAVGFLWRNQSAESYRRQYRSELERRALAERYACLTQYANDIILLADEQGCILEANHRALAVYGYQPEELRGFHLRNLCTPQAQEQVESLLEQLEQQGGLVYETTHQRKDGTTFPVEVSSRLIRIDGRRFYQSIAREITERKRFEESLKQAKQEAEMANRAKSEFLANMSHEIRTPMNAVIGMTSLLLDTPLTPEQLELVETIRSSGDLLLSIINHILDLTKIESGKLELERRSFNLQECLEEALDLMAPAAARKGLELACTFDPTALHAIFGDVTRLRQILINLLSNAVKFTERGEVAVSVSGGALQEGGQEVCFAVRDSGVGIPPEHLEKLFRPFTQADASTTRKYGGTGLGLAISKHLVEMMGGRIWVESQVGRGSTFYFTIQAQPAPGVPRSYPLGPQAELAGRKVLIVISSQTNRDLLIRYLCDWGVLAQAAASPSEGLAWIRRGNPFDLAILDQDLPEIREKGIALVTLTPTPETAGSYAASSARLSSPIKPSELYRCLMRVLTGPQDGGAASEGAPPPEFTPQLADQHPLRILLAEDNAVNQRVALLMLSRLGYRADVAANGAEVLEALRRQHYDLVLMDVQMPEMDGLEATRRIRQEWPPDCQPHIVAMTAGAFEEDRTRCLEAGMDQYISKPVRTRELTEALSRAGCPDTGA